MSHLSTTVHNLAKETLAQIKRLEEIGNSVGKDQTDIQEAAIRLAIYSYAVEVNEHRHAMATKREATS